MKPISVDRDVLLNLREAAGSMTRSQTTQVLEIMDITDEEWLRILDKADKALDN